MSGLIITASIVKTGKGRYVAHADVFPVMTKASTQRGAVKKLREAVLVLLRDAAEAGLLMNMLEEAGYTIDLIGFPGNRQPIIYNEHNVVVPVAAGLRALNRKRQPTDEEENSYALN